MTDRTETTRHATASTSLARVWRRWSFTIVWGCLIAGSLVAWTGLALVVAAIVAVIGA